MDLTIRSARSDDAGEIKKLEVECHLSPWPEKDYSEEALREGTVFLVAYESGSPELAGFIVMRLITTNEGCEASDVRVFEGEILNLAVAPRLRRRRIAQKLLATAIQWPDTGLIRDLFLEVRRSNETAQRFYQTCGFSVSGERKGFYTRPAEDAMLMSAASDKVLARFRGNGLVFEI